MEGPAIGQARFSSLMMEALPPQGAGRTGGGDVQSFVSDGGSDSGEILLLPINTRVRVVGNKRTKRALIGQEGVVRKSVGLGGWHWLKMDNGEVVKLQRNALHVVELCREPEVTGGLGEMDGEVATLSVGRHPSHPAAVVHGYRRHRVDLEPGFQARGLGRGGRVNFDKLGSPTLRRYLHASKVPCSPNASRTALLNAVQRHFEASQVDDMTVIRNLVIKGRRWGHHRSMCRRQG